MNILVVGPGAVGGYFGGMLAKAGEDVTFLAKEAYYNALTSTGLKIKSFRGDFSSSVHVIKDPSEIGETDLVLMCVKSYDTDKATNQIKNNVGKNTVVLSLQNGIHNTERIGRIIGKDKVIAGVVLLLAEVIRPWEICHYSRGDIILGELDNSDSPRLEKITDAFKNAEVSCSITNNIQKEQWGKLIWNTAFNPFTALTRSTPKELLGVAETELIIRKVMMETLNIANKSGININDSIVEDHIESTRQLDNSKTSMLQDLIKGKRLEIDAISGAVIAKGKEVGISTPYNDMLYTLLKHIGLKHVGLKHLSIKHSN